jgi:uncharacterized protein (DUF488 family)
VTAVFTTGYQQHPNPASLVTALRDAGVRRVVDVRELPLSRKPGFSKTALGEELRAGGIEYEHVRALGNPFRELYRAGRADEGRRRYAEHVETAARPALDQLHATIAREPTCLLCLEASHDECHRTVIADALQARDPSLRVVHLA